MAERALSARQLFETNGLSIAEWARVRGFSSGLVYQVLDGRRRCVRGQSHRIAVALGLKVGGCAAVEEVDALLQPNTAEETNDD
jgi:gp16 family phage-associated protein